MAKEAKKDPQELTVEQKLKALFQLQTMLSKIDEIKTLRGELPLEVQDLEDEIAGLSTRIDRIKAEVSELKSSIAGKKVEIETAKASVAKYKDQQDNVRNNREYDFLSKEIEFQTLEIELCEKRIKEFAAQEEEKSQEVAESTAALEERQKDLDVKKSELDEIISETKQEEEKLRDKAKELETKIEPRLLQSFKRIRKNSRNGLGIVYVQRDACGGCFNKIPPQRQLDIRSRKKIIVCEYCGRIMIDPELAGITPEQKVEVDAYLDRTKKRTERERIADRSVTGVFSGSYAINPFTGEAVPIWISDYVLAGYGTGAIMAVPAHDSRDYAFAKHFGL
ncbi:C4-type zinc ribbon domain-containing protein [Bacteroides rodentium]